MSSNLYILYPYDTKGKTRAMCTIIWNEPTPLKYVFCEAVKYFKKSLNQFLNGVLDLLLDIISLFKIYNFHLIGFKF